MKFEAEYRDFAKLSRSLEQFIQTLESAKFFPNRTFFLLVPGGFSDLIIRIIRIQIGKNNWF